MSRWFLSQQTLAQFRALQQQARLKHKSLLGSALTFMHWEQSMPTQLALFALSLKVHTKKNALPGQDDWGAFLKGHTMKNLIYGLALIGFDWLCGIYLDWLQAS